MSKARFSASLTVALVKLLLIEGIASAQTEIEEMTLERTLQLVEQLKEAQIDVATQPLTKAIQNRDKIRKLLHQFKEETIKLLADPDLMLNYALIRNDTSPRISGRVLKVGADEEFPTFQQASNAAKDGDTLQLGKGKFDFGLVKGLPSDILITGEGKEQTTLKADRNASGNLFRWRISNCSIDCNDNPFIEIREGAVEVINCDVSGYNSGAGGSNALYSSNAIVLIEKCLFEGNSGRSSSNGNGDAFDMRGDNLLYVRQTEFVDNDEIVRANFPCVFDRCRCKGSRFGVMPYPGSVILIREGATPVFRGKSATEILCALDDERVVKSIVDGSGVYPSERIENIVLKTGIRESLLYWIGLLRSENPVVAGIAREQLEKISNLKIEIEKETTDLQRDVVIGRLLNRVLSEAPELDPEQKKFLFRSENSK